MLNISNQSTIDTFLSIQIDWPYCDVDYLEDADKDD